MDNSTDHFEKNIPNSSEQFGENDTLPYQENLEYLSMLQKLRENKISWPHFSNDLKPTPLRSEASLLKEDESNNSETISNQCQESLENTSCTPADNVRTIECDSQQNKQVSLLISNASSDDTFICAINEDLVGVSNSTTNTMGTQCTFNSLNSKNCETRGTEYDPPDLSTKGIQCSLKDISISIVGQPKSRTSCCSACLEKCHLSSQHGVCSVILCKPVEIQSKEENSNEKNLDSMCTSNVVMQKETTSSTDIFNDDKKNECIDYSSTLYINKEECSESIFTSIPAERCSSGSHSTLCEEDGLTSKIIFKEKHPFYVSSSVETEPRTVKNQEYDICPLPDILSIDEDNLHNKICLENIIHDVHTTGIQCSTNNSDSANYQSCGTEYDPPNCVSQATQWSYEDCISGIPNTSTQSRPFLKCSECLKFCNTLSRQGVCNVIASQSTECLSKTKETLEESYAAQNEQNTKVQNISIKSNLYEVSHNRLRTVGVQCSLTLDSQNPKSQGIQCSLDAYNVILPEETRHVRICCSDCRKKCYLSSSHGKCNVISPKPSVPLSNRLNNRNISITNTQLAVIRKCSDCLKNCSALPSHERCSIVPSQPVNHLTYSTKIYPPNVMPLDIECSPNNHTGDNFADRVPERIQVCSNCIEKCNIGYKCMLPNITSLSMQSSIHGTKNYPPYLESQGIVCSIDHDFQGNLADRVTEKIPCCSDCVRNCNRSAQHGVCSVLHSQAMKLASNQENCENEVRPVDISTGKFVEDLLISNEATLYVESNKKLRTLDKKKCDISSSFISGHTETKVLSPEVILRKEVALDNSISIVNHDKGNEVVTTGVQSVLKALYPENNVSYGTQYDPPNVLSQGIQCSLEDLSGDISVQAETERIPVCSPCLRRCNISARHGLCNIISSQSADLSSKNSDKGGIRKKTELYERRRNIFSNGSASRRAQQRLPRSKISQCTEYTPPKLPSVSSKYRSTRNDDRELNIDSTLNPLVILRDIFKTVSKDPLVIKYLSNSVNIQGMKSIQERKDYFSCDAKTGAGMSISGFKSVHNNKCGIVSWKSPNKKKKLWNPSNEIVSVSDGNHSEQDEPATKCAKRTRDRKSFRKLNFNY